MTVMAMTPAGRRRSHDGRAVSIFSDLLNRGRRDADDAGSGTQRTMSVRMRPACSVNQWQNSAD
jgi:hypothetical protein